MGDKRAIGVFDSGLGGLSSVRQLIRLAPAEDIIFFGDTARVPYGGRPAETIVRYALEDISFLLERDVKMVVAACGTVSSALPAALSDRIPVPYTGVIGPTARAAAAATRNRRIGVIGTRATIKSGSFARELERILPGAVTVTQACPMFVPLVENGYFARNCEPTRYFAREYLAPLIERQVDTVILGCTHYPLIRDVISDVLGAGVTLIDSGYETAKAALALLDQAGLRNPDGGRHLYYTSDSPDDFSTIAENFLGYPVHDEVRRADLRAVKTADCFA